MVTGLVIFDQKWVIFETQSGFMNNKVISDRHRFQAVTNLDPVQYTSCPHFRVVIIFESSKVSVIDE